MKKLIIELSFLGILIVFSKTIVANDLPFKKLLLNKNYKNEIVSNNIFFQTKYSKRIFESTSIYSIKKYSTLDYNFRAYQKNEGYCYLIKTNSLKSIQVFEKKLNGLIKSGLSNIVSDEDWKDYLQFVDAGVIIATIPSQKCTILCYTKPCVFKSNEKRTIGEFIKLKEVSQIYILNCGGKEFGRRIK